MNILEHKTHIESLVERFLSRNEYIRNNFSKEQMNLIYFAYEHGLSIPQVELIANPSFSIDEMKDNYQKVLDSLLKSESSQDRKIVADHCYKLEQLLYDSHPYVREAVARQGYGLEVLVNDPDFRIRYVVAKQGYGLEQLSNDEHEGIRYMAQQMLLKKEKSGSN